MYIVGVTGGTGSGKTTFVNGLLKNLDPNNISYIYLAIHIIIKI